MKKIISYPFFIITICLCILFVGFEQSKEINKSLATVEQEQGIYIFIKSKPSAEYQFLGSVKKGIALTGSPEEMFNSMLKKCKKDYPQADGIIFTSAGMDKADCIKFK